MVLIHIIAGMIGAVLKAMTESFLGLVSMLISSVLVLAVVAFVAFSISGVVGLRLGKRSRGERGGREGDGP